MRAAYHVQRVKASLDGCAGREAIIDTRADNDFLALKDHLAELGSANSRQLNGGNMVKREIFNRGALGLNNWLVNTDDRLNRALNVGLDDGGLDNGRRHIEGIKGIRWEYEKTSTSRTLKHRKLLFGV